MQQIRTTAGINGTIGAQNGYIAILVTVCCRSDPETLFQLYISQF